MYEVVFYQDNNGRQPVLDYIMQLRNNSSKDSRIKLKKINDYIQALSIYGVMQLSENHVKHLAGDIWELRPISDRILFASFADNGYVLLHRFAKKTQKTPIREIKKAQRELIDFKERSGLYG